MRKDVSIEMAALAIVAGVTGMVAENPDFARPARRRIRRHIPNDRGPVIDTTRESKRARRRRLAREGK